MSHKFDHYCSPLDSHTTVVLPILRSSQHKCDHVIPFIIRQFTWLNRLADHRIDGQNSAGRDVMVHFCKGFCSEESAEIDLLTIDSMVHVEHTDRVPIQRPRRTKVLDTIEFEFTEVR